MQIILLRGLGREAAHWGGFTDKLNAALANISGNASVTTIDFPGCGQWVREPACKSIAAMTKHARVQRNAIMGTTSTRIVVIGLSMGGMVALDWAHRYPEEVARIIIINSSLGDQPLHWRLRMRALPFALIALLLPRNLREHLILRLVSNERQRVIFSANLDHWQSIQKQRPVKWQNLITMLRCASAFKAPNNLSPPGLVIASEKDYLVSVKSSQDIAQRYQWPISYHPSAGHDLPLDADVWLCQTIIHWLYYSG